MNLLDFFRKKTVIEPLRTLIVFEPNEEERINQIISNSKLDFSYINDYARELFVFTANLFNDDIINMQSKFVNKATKDIDETLDTLINMSKNSDYDSFMIKEANFISHFYKKELENYILLVKEKKEKGIKLFKEYDIYIEAAGRFIGIQESQLKENKSQDHFEIHLKQEIKKDIERFKEKVSKLRANKLYHSQTLAQMSVLSVTNEKLYDQVREIIFLVIPVLKNKNSISTSITQLQKIKAMVSI
jgi:uncharacterized protein YaaN involved in tellurite resistance